MINLAFHYPPEVMQLLIDTIPLLCRSKQDVLLFFKGAGVPESQYQDIRLIIVADRDKINKYEIVRRILTRVNERGDAGLKERREILKRVVDFEDFSTCWPSDQLKAKGLVSEIRRVVNVKDTFTRIEQERKQERSQRINAIQAEREAIENKRREFISIKDSFFSLFGENNAYVRGKSLEGILNRLFKYFGISIKEAFTVKGDEKQGIVEQIDGVIEIDGQLYFAEMKWWAEPIGRAEISNHLVRVYHRGQTRGIFISASDYSDAAIVVSKEALQKTVFILCKLEELVKLLERDGDLVKFLKAKIFAAQTNKAPYHDALACNEC